MSFQTKEKKMKKILMLMVMVMVMVGVYHKSGVTSCKISVCMEHGLV